MTTTVPRISPWRNFGRGVTFILLTCFTLIGGVIYLCYCGISDRMDRADPTTGQREYEEAQRKELRETRRAGLHMIAGFVCFLAIIAVWRGAYLWGQGYYSPGGGYYSH